MRSGIRKEDWASVITSTVNRQSIVEMTGNQNGRNGRIMFWMRPVESSGSGTKGFQQKTLN